MKLLCVHLNEKEYLAIKKYAITNHLTMSKAFKNAFFEKLEDEYDIDEFNKAYAHYLKNKKSYSSQEVSKILKF